MGKDEGMNPVNWGWGLQDDRFIPLMIHLKAPPDHLYRRFIATAPLPARHSAALVDDMDCHAPQSA